ncbi:hypothetical protein [Pseudobdellovibrio exovorus]|uniref:Uncharacterized protein n=1 Tax=Pseudobdellovibrio exovorus JSS TaxID=1184267 RepID=M4VCQ4_9BACT|nr:hypothetical protein [Pseudobdellovibrio exovorus]AGH95821.1 hypothetical protein A11Q_1605 [Pseudobdellovibrio exovorus JSS]
MRLFFEKYLNNWFFKLLGVVVVGLITNAIWDYYGRAFVTVAGDAILWIISVFNSTVIDEIYKNAAKGFREEILLSFYNLVIGVLLAVIFVMQIKIFKVFHKNSKANFNGSIESRKASAERSILIMYIMSAFLIFQFTQKIRTNNLIAKYRQALTACIPYMEEVEVKQLESRFAQLQSKKEYELIYQYLESVAHKNNLHIPAL